MNAAAQVQAAHAASASQGAQSQPSRPTQAGLPGADVLRNLAIAAFIEYETSGASVGSVLGQKAACLAWLASEAEYQRWLSGSPRAELAALIEAEQAVARQFRTLGV